MSSPSVVLWLFKESSGEFLCQSAVFESSLSSAAHVVHLGSCLYPSLRWETPVHFVSSPPSSPPSLHPAALTAETNTNLTLNFRYSAFSVSFPKSLLWERRVEVEWGRKLAPHGLCSRRWDQDLLSHFRKRLCDVFLSGCLLMRFPQSPLFPSSPSCCPTEEQPLCLCLSLYLSQLITPFMPAGPLQRFSCQIFSLLCSTESIFLSMFSQRLPSFPSKWRLAFCHNCNQDVEAIFKHCQSFSSLEDQRWEKCFSTKNQIWEYPKMTCLRCLTVSGSDLWFTLSCRCVTWSWWRICSSAGGWFFLWWTGFDPSHSLGKDFE